MKGRNYRLYRKLCRIPRRLVGSDVIDKAWDKACLLGCLILALFPLCGEARPPGLRSLVRQGDILIYDDHRLRGNAEDWTVPSDYQQAFNGKKYGGGIPSEIRSGRFGQQSGQFLYTTWRHTLPLSDELYAEGKTTIYQHHVSELVTPPFEVSLDYITFLLSGGNMPNEVCLNLLVDGEVVRTVSGRNNDVLEWVAFDVKEFRGKEAKVQILDTSTAAFGYIAVDCICQSPNPKDAVRIIAEAPSSENGGGIIETLAGQFNGSPAIVDGVLNVGAEIIDFNDVLNWETGIAAAEAIAGNRLKLANGDLLVAEVLGLEEDQLLIRHAEFGEMNLPIADVAQALFQPGPPVDAAPGTLIHANGNKIPGELLWIRDDSISIKCSLGVIPLPKARVRSFIFSEEKPATTTGDTVLLADGSTLSGQLSFKDEHLLLANDALGSVTLDLSSISNISRTLQGVTPFATLEGTIFEQVGPIPPPDPIRVEGNALRIFPRTAIRYQLPDGEGRRSLRATLAPIPNSKVTMTTLVRAGAMTKTYTIPPDDTGLEINLDLGSVTEIEIVADAAGTISYPCGIEFRNAFILEGQAP